MADYPRQGDLARSLRSRDEALRRVRTRRPLNDQVPTPGWHIEGELFVGRLIGPMLIRIYDDHPEHKEIIGFNGWLQSGGPVTVRWHSNLISPLGDDQTITAGEGNEMLLETPLVVENGDLGGEFIRPEIVGVEDGSTPPLCLYVYVRTTPI